jgi:hypothetical protein
MGLENKTLPKIDIQSFNWPEVMVALGYPKEAFDTSRGGNGKHTACPSCGDGGKGRKSDRFRYCPESSNKGYKPDRVYCSQCRVTTCLGVHIQATGKSEKEAFKDVIAASRGIYQSASSSPRIQAPPTPKGPDLKMRALLEKCISGAQKLSVATPVGFWFAHRVPGLDIRRFGPDLMYHPNGWLPKSLVQDDSMEGSEAKGKTFPMLLSIARDKDGQIEMAHRTVLTMRGRKAFGDDVKCRFYFGPVTPLKSRTVTLCAGNGISTTVLIAEGIETAASLLAESSGRNRIVAALDANNIEIYEWPEGTTKIVNYVDHDFIDPRNGRRRGHHASAKLKERVEAAGLIYEEKIPPIEGQDFNDVYLERYKSRRIAA